MHQRLLIKSLACSVSVWVVLAFFSVQAIKADEVELLKFGLKWLKWLLFKEGEFELKIDE